MLTIWGRLNSHNVKKVAWAAIEMDLPQATLAAGLGAAAELAGVALYLLTP